MSTNETEHRSRTLDLFWFLVDAPMFIDSVLVERMHDAIIRPSEIFLSRSALENNKEQQERKYALSGKGDAAIPFVAAAAIKGGFGHNVIVSEDQTSGRQYSIPRTPERLLEELVAFYLAHFEERVVAINPGLGTVRLPGDSTTYGHEKLNEICHASGPRPIVLIDAPPGSKLMPMAGEFSDGTVDVIYDRIADDSTKRKGPMERFEKSQTLSRAERDAKWNSFIERFESRPAMFLLEEGAKDHKGGRYEWLDFRLPWGKGAPPSPLHLHIMPRGQYSMGTFAHAFVNRGHSNGVRMIGTLKSGGDINVLAIYEV